MDAQAYVTALRELADWIEENQEELDNEDIGNFTPPSTVYWFTHSREQFARAVRVLGRGAKSKDEQWFNVTRDFSGLAVEATCQRSLVCERVVHGTRTVTKLVPDPDVPMVEVTEEVEDVEWVCPPALLADEVVI